MAERLLQEHESHDREQIIARAFLLAYGRKPAPEEMDVCLHHWQLMTTRHQSLQLEDVIPPSRVTRTFVDENTGEQFSYTEQLEQNRNYIPELQPSQADALTRGLAEVCLVLLASNEMLYVP